MFDMRTSNIGLNPDMMNNSSDGCSAKIRRESSNLYADRNGKPKVISNGQNHNGRTGYSRNGDSLLGNPNGISPEVDHLASVHHMLSSDNNAGIEANGENLKKCGTPKVNRHTTGTPLVEATLVPTTDLRRLYNEIMTKKTDGGSAKR